MTASNTSATGRSMNWLREKFMPACIRRGAQPRVRTSQPIVRQAKLWCMQTVSTGVERDALSDVLASVRFRSALLCRSELKAPWGFGISGRDFATFHLVLEGGGWLDVEGAAQ